MCIRDRILDRCTRCHRCCEHRVESVAELCIEVRCPDDGAKELRERICIFVRGAGTADACDLGAVECPEALADEIDRFSPRCFAERAIVLDERRCDPILGLDMVEHESVLVGEPAMVRGCLLYTSD